MPNWFSIYIKLSVCLCVRYARSNQWMDLDQTLHAGSLPPTADYRGYKLSLLAGTFELYLLRMRKDKSCDDFTCWQTSTNMPPPKSSNLSGQDCGSRAHGFSPSSRVKGGPCSSQKWANKSISIKNLNNVKLFCTFPGNAGFSQLYFINS